jgi:hypothetical protein
MSCEVLGEMAALYGCVFWVLLAIGGRRRLKLEVIEEVGQILSE